MKAKIMKVKIEDLVSAIERTLKAIGRTLNGITIRKAKDVLEIHRTNGSSYAVSKIAGIPGSQFRAQIDGSRLLNLLKGVDPAQDCEILMDDKFLRVHFGSVKAKLPLLAEEYTLLSDTQWGGYRKALTLGTDCRQMLRQVIPACADDKDSRYFLRGVLLDRCPEGKLILVGTNGNWMTTIHTGFDTQNWPTKDVIVPTQMLTTLVDSISQKAEVDVEFATGENGAHGIYFKTNDFEFLSPLIEAKYPLWKKVMPMIDESESFQVAPSGFLSAVKRMHSIISGAESYHGIDLFVKDKTLKVLAKTTFDTDSNDVSVEAIDLDDTNAEADMLINATYLVDALLVANEAKIQVQIANNKLNMVDGKAQTVIMGMTR